MGLTSKRFLLFAGENYYPNGLEDFVGAYDTREEAREEGKRIKKSENAGVDWFEILDTEDLPITFRQRDLMKEGLL